MFTRAAGAGRIPKLSAMTTVRPYGAWTSPIDASALVSGAAEPGSPAVDGTRIVWLRSRPDEQGRLAVMTLDAGGEVQEISPPGFNARTRVHEYGGGALAAGGGVILACSWADHRVHRIDPEHRTTTPVTAESATPAGKRWAAMAVETGGRWFVAVRETHGADRPEGGAATDEARNEIVHVDLATGAETVLVTGRDFVGDPWPSPDGTRLAWLAWDHPEMPWDAAELWVGELAPDGRQVLDPRRILGGLTPDGPYRAVAVADAAWAPDGSLVLAHDADGWFRLARWTADGAVTDLEDARPGLEHGGPRWVHGTSTVCVLGDGTVISAAGDRGLLHLRTAEGTAVTGRDVTHVASLTAQGNCVVAVLAGPDIPMSLTRVDPVTGAIEVVDAAERRPDLAGLAVPPQPITFATGPPDDRGEIAHALYYAPTGDDVRGPADERPPVIVATHGGPTGHARPYGDLATLYWTSRGFAVVDVNYRGSAGFGRAYRDALRGRWGIVDVEDVVAAVDHLAAEGMVDGHRAVIRGGSAGGYTTLMALCVTETFAAGTSYFGVGDLAALAADTHKFESRYLDGLIGPWPAAEAIYRDRSPIHRTASLSTPMLILQGDQDAVVPPAQAEAMVAALREKGVPHAYILFEGEQHGFRKADSIVRAREAELAFYGRILGIDVDPKTPLELWSP